MIFEAIFPIFFLFVGMLIMGLTIMAVVDIIRCDFKGDYKIIWLLVVLLLSVIGPILYFLMGKEHKIDYWDYE